MRQNQTSEVTSKNNKIKHYFLNEKYNSGIMSIIKAVSWVLFGCLEEKTNYLFLSFTLNLLLS